MSGWLDPVIAKLEELRRNQSEKVKVLSVQIAVVSEVKQFIEAALKEISEKILAGAGEIMYRDPEGAARNLRWALAWSVPTNHDNGYIRIVLEDDPSQEGRYLLKVSGFCPHCCPEQTISTHETVLRTTLVALLKRGMNHHPELF